MKTFIYRAGNSYGPYSEKTIRRFIDQGDLSVEDRIWEQKSKKWIFLKDLQKNKYEYPKNVDKMGYKRNLFLSQNGVIYGPYSGYAISKYLQNGDISSTAFIWKKNNLAWEKIDAFSKHFSYQNHIEHTHVNRTFRLWIGRNQKIYGPYPPAKVANWVNEKKLSLDTDWAFPSDYRLWIKLNGVRQVRLILFNRNQSRSCSQKPQGIASKPLPKTAQWYIIDSGYKET
jgi:hypothetical protein